MNKPKIDKNISNNLFSPNTEIVLSAIQKIKEKGNKDYLPLLFDFLVSNKEMEIEIAILNLLETVKDKESVPAFIEAIQNKKYNSILKKIVTACWQNGLDFSEYIEVFIDLVIHEDWEIAFEAFTVIENLEFQPNEEIRNMASVKIIAALKTISERKKYFLEEILKMI